MMSLNVEKLYAKFRDITESIDRLKQFADLTPGEFLKNRDNVDVACYRLIVATEAAIDICLHISAKLLKKVAEDYASCFTALADDGLIDRELAVRLAKIARFRNLLVHHYWKIDYSRLYEIIVGQDLEDLNEFIRQVERLEK